MSKKSVDLEYMKKVAMLKTGVRAGEVPPIVCYGVITPPDDGIYYA